MNHRNAVRLLTALVVAAVAGGLCGWLLGPRMTAVGWVGALFLDALKMTIVPLVVASMITGVAALGDVRRLGRTGGFTLSYFIATTGIAVAIGLVLVNAIGPGADLGAVAASQGAAQAREPATAVDIVRSLVAPNIVAAAADMQLLPVIGFSLLFGAALTTLGAAGAPVIAFFAGVNATMLRLVGWLMWLAPIGVFALIASRLGEAGGGAGVAAEVRAVGAYVVTVVAGLLLHFAVLCAVLVTLGGRTLAYVADMGRALVTAFATASSSATLPLSIECADEAGVDRRAVQFVLPLGATVNMNGTALYEAVAALFIAQAYGIELGPADQVIVFLTATLAAVGAAGIPEAGLVTMAIVLTAVGLPLEGMGLLLAVDWILDRFRTTVNVWSDHVGATVVARTLPRES